MNAVNQIVLDNSGILTSAQGEAIGDDAGNINIDPTFVILRQADILAQAEGGDGGAITLVVDNLISDTHSTLDASSSRGNDGEVIIESPVNSISGAIGVLEVSTDAATVYIDAPCEARALSASTSLVIALGEDTIYFPEAYRRGTDEKTEPCHRR